MLPNMNVLDECRLKDAECKRQAKANTLCIHTPKTIDRSLPADIWAPGKISFKF